MAVATPVSFVHSVIVDGTTGVPGLPHTVTASTAPASGPNTTTITNTTVIPDPDHIAHILQELSDARAVQLLPVFIVFAAVFLLGLLGNSLIVYIYWAKFKASWSRSAIVALGTFDLMSCVLAVPSEVVDLRYSFNYYSDVSCRLFRAAATFPNVASGIMLTAVAYDRYRLICTPLKTSVSRARAGLHVLVVCAVSLVVTGPAAVVYGTMEVSTTVDNVTVVGTECSTSDLVKHTKLPLLNNLLLALVFLVAFVAMVVFYFLIGLQIYRQGEFRKTLMHMSNRKRSNTQSELETSFVSDADGKQDLSQSSDSHRHSACVRGQRSRDDDDDGGKSDTQPPCSPDRLAPPSPRRQLSRSPSRIMQRLRKNSSLDSHTRKTSVMLCLISLAFVLSFLPHLAVKLLRLVDKEFLTDDASTSRLVAYNLCARSYFLNSFVNVFIYGFCSFRFRRECRKVMNKLLRWKCCR